MYVNLRDVGEFNERSLYAGLQLDYKLSPWTPTSALRAGCAVAELLVINLVNPASRCIMFLH